MMVVLLLPCAWANASVDWANTNPSANTITIKLLLLILFMIQWSPSPPLRKSGKDALFRGRSPDSRPNYSPTLRAFPSDLGQWLFRRGFRCRSQLRGQWRHCTALPAHLWRIVVSKRDRQGMQTLLLSLTYSEAFNF